MADSNLKTVIIADDDPEDRDLICDAFMESRVANPLMFVADGQELMDYLHREKPGREPCLILLDLNMPKKNGREVLAEIRADPELRHIPIVIFTTSRSEDDVAVAYDIGANSFIPKPLTYDGLIDVVQHLRDYWLDLVVLPGRS